MISVVLTIVFFDYLNSTESIFNRNKLMSACKEADIVLPEKFETIDHRNIWVDFHGDDGTSEWWTLRSKTPPYTFGMQVWTKDSPDFREQRDRVRSELRLSDPTEIREIESVDGMRGYRVLIAKEEGDYSSSLVFLYD